MERVLNVTIGGRHKLYPFSVFANVPVINDQVGDMPVAVFSRMGTLSALDDTEIRASRVIPSATAFDARFEGRRLLFEISDGAFVDQATKSRWNLFGRALKGPLRGAQLRPAPGGVHFAFAWLAFNPDSDIYGR